MPSTLSNIELLMGPADLGAPDNLEAAIIAFIDGASKTLDIAVQELESRPIAEAILRARIDRKVRVRLILESLYLVEKKPTPDPWTPSGDNAANRTILDALLSGTVEARMDLNPETFHQKFVVRDAEESSAAILTGSANFTPTDMHMNLNHVVTLHGKPVTQPYAEEFEELWTGTFGELQERRDPKPREPRVSKIRTKVLFAPDHAPEMEIMKQMLKGKQRVDFAMFTFANSSGIDDTMIVLDRSGIPVRGILDRGQGNQTWAASRPLHNAGAEMYLVKAGGPVRKLHHKLMVIDEQVIIAGSFNYTSPANTLNDENIVVIGDLEEKDTDSIAAQRQFAQYALSEIDRMITAYGEILH